MIIKSLLIVLNSLVAAVIISSVLRKTSWEYRILISRQGIPLIGGLAIGGAFLLAALSGFLFYGWLTPGIAGTIAASFLMLIFGVIDDLRELSVAIKLLVQLIAASLLVFFGVRTQIIHIGNTANIIITLIWVLSVTNAFNHLDVMDGVAGSSALIATIAFFVLAVFSGDINAMVLSLSLAGALAGFLFFNLPPAKIYMGNSGSHFLGFVLSAIALLISYAPLGKKVALLSPLLILGFPILDTAFLIFLRMRKNKLPFRKSNDHLALRFLAAGYSKKKSLFIMACLALLFSFCGILVSLSSDTTGAVITISIVLLSLALAKRMGRVRIDA